MGISVNENEIAGEARDVLETLLELMEISASIAPLSEVIIEEETGESAGVTLNIEGEDLGILIGRRGQTLACLQYIVKLIVGHRTKVWRPIIIDIEGYKRRRSDALQALAWRMAEQVKANGTAFVMDPMSAFDRRTIHLALAEHLDVTTESSGDGEARRVVIIPRE